MTRIPTILVSDIPPADARKAGWWFASDSQGEVDMTGLTLAEARAELLDQAGKAGAAGILAGSIQILEEE
jgi:hypothetical protein